MTDAMSAPPRILVVDDDSSVREAIVEFLEGSGLLAVPAADAGQADALMAEEAFDVIVLDVMLPDEDGLSVCRRLSATGPPIIMVSAMGSTVDRIVGLELGAADYLGKPFEPRELLARIRSVIRQRRRLVDASSTSTVLAFSGLTYDPVAALLCAADGRRVALTAGEIALLDAFVSRPGRLLGRDQLLDLTHADADGPFDRAIDLAVSRLRRKLRDAGGGECVETVRGVGYRFTCAVVPA